MRTLILSASLLSLALLAPACPPAPVSPDAGDAGTPDAAPDAPAPSTPYTRACANLAALGCADGADPKCASSLERIDTQRLSNVDVACIAVATTKAAVRTCGPVCR